MAVTSVLAQSEAAWSLIIIDDGSTDDTLAVARRYAEQDPRIEVISLPENQGLGMALNAGLARTNTPFFVILDSDDWLAPDTLALGLDAFHTKPASVSLVSANAVVWQEQTDGRLVEQEHIPGRAFDDQYAFLLYGPTLVPRFLRTKTVRQVGGFEADPISGGRMAEDRWLLLKLIHISTFAYIDRDLYHIRVHANNMTKPENRQQFQAVKRYLYERVLKDWGDEYEAEFYIHPEGWLDVKAIRPKHA
jgi:glycosyltransferase involved in cell wall biosynthesis